MDIEAEVVTLNDGLYYVILDEISAHSNVYVYLSNTEDPRNFCVRKRIQNNVGSLLVGLDDDDEYNMAMKLYFEKNKK